LSAIEWLLIIVHVALCCFLVLLVLVQNDKGGGLAGAFGGGAANSPFSGAGAATFLQKLTNWVAILFGAVVIAINIFVTGKQNISVESELGSAARKSGLGHVLPVEGGSPLLLPGSDFEVTPMEDGAISE
jgi:preprotein translocase subunit SecG